jgi:hypothetical protein
MQMNQTPCFILSVTSGGHFNQCNLTFATMMTISRRKGDINGISKVSETHLN